MQNAYVQDWIDNTMIFLEVDDVDRLWNELPALGLTAKYKNAKPDPIREHDRGGEFY